MDLLSLADFFINLLMFDLLFSISNLSFDNFLLKFLKIYATKDMDLYCLYIFIFLLSLNLIKNLILPPFILFDEILKISSYIFLNHFNLFDSKIG